MADVRATFVADFRQWNTALEDAKARVKAFEYNTKGIQDSLQRMVRAFDGSRIQAEAMKMAAAIDKIGGANKLTAAEQARVNATVTEAIAKYAALGKQAPPELEKLAAATRRLGAAAGTAGPAASKLEQAMGLLSRSVLTYVGPAALGAAVIGTARWAGELDDLSAKTNISTTTLQRMTYAAERSGTSLESATGAVQVMARLMGDRDKGFVAAVGELGLNFDQLRRQDPGQTFLDLAQAIDRVEDPYRRAALKQDLFGRGAKELDGFLKELSGTLKKDLPVASEETIKKLGEFDDQMSQLKVTVKVAIASVIGSLGQLNDWMQRHPWVTGLLNPGQYTVQSIANATQTTLPKVGAPPALPTAGGFDTPSQLALREAATKRFLEGVGKQTVATHENTAALKAHRDALLRVPTTPVSFANLSGPFAPGATLGTTPTLLGGTSGKAFAAQLLGGASVLLPSRNLGGGLTLAPNLTAPKGIPLPGPSWFTQAFGGMSGLSAGLTGTLMGSLMGGGSTSRSLGGYVGSSLGNWGGSALSDASKVLGGTAGKIFGALGSAIPIVGSFLGPVLGGLFGKLFGGSKEKQENKQATQQIQDYKQALLGTYGSLDKIRVLGGQAGAALAAAFGSQGKAGLQQFQKLLEQFQAQQTRLQAALEKYGLTWEALGAQQRQLYMTEGATALLKDFDALIQAGVDETKVLQAMAASWSEVYQQAQRTGTQLPGELEVILQKLIDMGLLVTDAGDLVGDLSNISFSPLLASLKAVETSLYGIKQAGRAAEDVLPSGYYKPGSPVEGPIAHAGGLVVGRRIQKFHRGGLAQDELLAVLQSGEAVLSRAAVRRLGQATIGRINRGMSSAAGALGGVGEVQVLLDGEVLTRAVLRRGAGVLRAYGVA